MNASLIDASGHLKDTFPLALKAFQRACVHKIAHSGPLHPEMVNLVLALMGGDIITDEYPEGVCEPDEAITRARKSLRVA
jgi:hypothetical protein